MRVLCINPSQVKLLRELFKEALGADQARAVDINTIDGFQVGGTGGGVCGGTGGGGKGGHGGGGGGMGNWEGTKGFGQAG